MAIKYYSEQLNKLFNSVEELKEAEDKVNAAKKAEEERKAKVKAERETRAKEVEEAFKLANEDTKKAYALLDAFVKDFGPFHTTIKGAPVSLFDALFNLF